jgi:hypothetical protein
MTTSNVVSELANKWWPLSPEKFFTAQRAPDMWFGDELPPTVQAEMRSPLVTQSKWMMRVQVQQNLAQHAQRHAAQAEVRRQAMARSRVGKRTKASRH